MLKKIVFLALTSIFLFLIFKLSIITENNSFHVNDLIKENNIVKEKIGEETFEKLELVRVIDLENKDRIKLYSDDDKLYMLLFTRKKDIAYFKLTDIIIENKSSDIYIYNYSDVLVIFGFSNEAGSIRLKTTKTNELKENMFQKNSFILTYMISNQAKKIEIKYE